jgi:hypothetical protein
VINFQDECSRDLAAAEPIIAEAEAALNSLDKASLGELKSFGSPAAEVVQVGRRRRRPSLQMPATNKACPSLSASAALHLLHPCRPQSLST